MLWDSSAPILPQTLLGREPVVITEQGILDLMETPGNVTLSYFFYVLVHLFFLCVARLTPQGVKSHLFMSAVVLPDYKQDYKQCWITADGARPGVLTGRNAADAIGSRIYTSVYPAGTPLGSGSIVDTNAVQHR